MSYVHRDEKGTMKAQFDNRQANDIFANCAGYFKEVNYTSGKKLVFEFTSDNTLHVQGGRIVIYFWKGDRLIPVDQ